MISHRLLWEEGRNERARGYLLQGPGRTPIPPDVGLLPCLSCIGGCVPHWNAVIMSRHLIASTDNREIIQTDRPGLWRWCSAPSCPCHSVNHRPLCYIPVLIHRITTAPLRETIRRPTCHLRPSHRAPATRPLLLVLEPVLYPSRLFKMCIIRLATLQILIINIIVTITTIITKRASLQRPELALEVVETQLAEGWP